MLTSDEKTLVPSLIQYIKSDLFALENISSSTTVTIPETTDILGNQQKWEVIIDYLPLEFYRLIESYPNIYTVEKFDKKYIRNPKLCAYDRYGMTNMWRPIMILNRCPSICKFDFEYIRYYNISVFSNILSVLISRVQNNE